MISLRTRLALNMRDWDMESKRVRMLNTGTTVIAGKPRGKGYTVARINEIESEGCGSVPVTSKPSRPHGGRVSTIDIRNAIRFSMMQMSFDRFSTYSALNTSWNTTSYDDEDIKAAIEDSQPNRPILPRFSFLLFFSLFSRVAASIAC